MAVFVCRRCEYTQPESWSETCPGCGGLYRATRLGVASTAQGGSYTTLGGSKHKSGHVYLSTGNAGFDHVLGGGLVAGRVVLIGGFEGTGKSRLLLTTADGIVIYASGEESEDDVNGIAANLGIVNDRVIVLGSQRSVEKVLEVAKKLKAFLVVYDSAQKFASDFSGADPGSGPQCRAIGEAIKDHCGATKTCAIIVNQMSGSGEMKSGTELRHHCDTIMVLAYPKDDDEDAPSEPDVRVLSGGKNRVGRENQKSYFKMTDAGVLEHIPAKSKLVSSSRGRYGKRDEDNE